MLGTNKVPNFQGMFLRGAGSQTFSQVNGTAVNFDLDMGRYTNGAETPTVHTSGAIGEIQGDGARREIVDFDGSFMQVSKVASDSNDIHLTQYDGGGSTWHLVKNGDGSLRGWGHLETNGNQFDSKYNAKQIRFSTNPKHYRYRLNGGGSYYSLSEYTSPAEDDEAITIYFYADDIGTDNALFWPMAGEFRPVNIAVKYYIRAK